MTLDESFGSLFWPVKRPELLTYLIDSIPANLTFLLSDAAAMTGLTDEMKASLEHRGKVVKFTPQWKVLNHPAVAFFVVSITFVVPFIVLRPIRVTSDLTRCKNLSSRRCRLSRSPSQRIKPKLHTSVGRSSSTLPVVFS